MRHQENDLRSSGLFQPGSHDFHGITSALILATKAVFTFKSAPLLDKMSPRYL
jgi:hypothetical protein